MTHNPGLVGRLHLAELDLVPLDAPEEGVVFDVSLAVGAATQPLSGGLRQ